MTFSNQNRKPTKGCRRGKNNNGGCSINFNNQTSRLKSFLLCASQMCDNNALSHILFIILVLGILATLIFFIFIFIFIFLEKDILLNIVKFIHNKDINDFTPIFPIAACTIKSKFTKDALAEVEVIYNEKFKQRKSNKIRLRDIKRSHAKSVRNATSLKNIRKEVKYLKDNIRGLKKEIRTEKKRKLKKKIVNALKKFFLLIKKRIIYLLLLKKKM
jgi:hypothetical protein